MTPTTLPPPTPDPTRPRRSTSSRVLITVSAVLFGLSAVALAGALAVKRFTMASEAMSPTLRPSTVVWALPVDGASVHRGDVVIIAVHDQSHPDITTKASRVVAIAGDTIESKSDALLVNIAPVAEPYLEPGMVTQKVDRTVVPAGTVYTLGDNRTNSKDSRFTGPVAYADVLDRVILNGAPQVPFLVLAALITGVLLVCAWRFGGPKKVDDLTY